MDSVKKLTLDSLKQLLDERDLKRDFKLSDIQNPANLENATYAAKRIADAIRNKEKIVLVGDYDVDGVTSTAICKLFFREIGVDLECHIPNRFRDGYGVSPTILERIEADVIFTVDNGISAIEAAEVCKRRGIDLIITDHHTPSDILPDCYAIVNPKLSTCNYQHQDICGAQVAWLFLALLKKELDAKVDMSIFLEYLALAIVADVMPLTNINRTLVQHGLKRMKNSSRPYAQVINTFLNKSRLTSEDIGFQIAPRLNSAGRLEDASIALDFLTAQSEHEAYKQFELLNQLNDMRKATEADVTEVAMMDVNPNDKVIVVAGESWNEGVVGIVASRLVDKFGRPAIVLSIHDGIAKGSARSIGDIDIYKLCTINRTLLEKFGGHTMAAGMSLKVENIEAFRAGLNASAQETYTEEDYKSKESIIGELHASDINFDLLHLIEQYEPYGEANPRPIFLAHNADVLHVKRFGADKSHSRINIRLAAYERESFDILAFRQQYEVARDKKITCSYSVTKNEFNGKVSLQLMLAKIYS